MNDKDKILNTLKEKGLEYTTKSEESATVEEGKVIRKAPSDSPKGESSNWTERELIAILDGLVFSP